MLRNSSIALFISLVIFATSCGNSGKEASVVASIYDYQLTYDDLAAAIPDGLKGLDSSEFAHNFVDQWLHEKAILHYAAGNMMESQDDFEKQVEDFKNSLMIFNYQKLYLAQNLDTIVDETEIKDFYESNSEEFLLKNNIVKVAFLKLPKNSRNIPEARMLLKGYSTETRDKLEDLAERNAVNYFLDDDIWILFDDLLKEVPIKTYNEENFLQNTKYIELSDSLYTTLAYIIGFRTKESVSPLSFEYERIRMIIINNRKQKLLQTMEEELFKKAGSDGAIKYFKSK